MLTSVGTGYTHERTLEYYVTIAPNYSEREREIEIERERERDEAENFHCFKAKQAHQPDSELVRELRKGRRASNRPH
jgi:hypothetical protein